MFRFNDNCVITLIVDLAHVPIENDRRVLGNVSDTDEVRLRLRYDKRRYVPSSEL